MDVIDDDSDAIFASNGSDVFATNATLWSEVSNQTQANNYSEYIVPPEKEGSPYAACASIVFKSDLKVS